MRFASSQFVLSILYQISASSHSSEMQHLSENINYAVPNKVDIWVHPGISGIPIGTPATSQGIIIVITIIGTTNLWFVVPIILFLHHAQSYIV